MYITLFSASYSRYSDARPDATRLISLDEAFAGVDENNIRDMFDLLKTGLAEL
ncbi:MAG: SbcC/MukB-like Walker B domain-containing protein [Desulfosporosinus fructosivorans]